MCNNMTVFNWDQKKNPKTQNLFVKVPGLTNLQGCILRWSSGQTAKVSPDSLQNSFVFLLVCILSILRTFLICRKCCFGRESCVRLINKGQMLKWTIKSGLWYFVFYRCRQSVRIWWLKRCILCLNVDIRCITA